MANMWRLKSNNIERVAVEDSGANAGFVSTLVKTDAALWIPGNSFLAFGTGVWTAQRNAANDLSLQKDTGDETDTLTSPSLRPVLRTTASKGFQITSIDVVYSIATAALDAHTAVLSDVTYANITAVAVTSHGGSLSGTLATATDADPYVTTLTPGTPAFDNGSLVDLRLEISVDAAATSVYDLYGIFVRYSFNWN